MSDFYEDVFAPGNDVINILLIHSKVFGAHLKSQTTGIIQTTPVDVKKLPIMADIR